MAPSREDSREFHEVIYRASRQEADKDPARETRKRRRCTRYKIEASQPVRGFSAVGTINAEAEGRGLTFASRISVPYTIRLWMSSLPNRPSVKTDGKRLCGALRRPPSRIREELGKGSSDVNGEILIRHVPHDARHPSSLQRRFGAGPTSRGSLSFSPPICSSDP